MTAVMHEERALIHRLLENGNVSPEEWDRAFAHMRRCESCAEHYASLRAQLGTAMPGELSPAEDAAMRRVLTLRAEQQRSPWWSRAAQALRAHPLPSGGLFVAALAALLWVLPEQHTNTKGGDVAPQLVVSCSASGLESELRPLASTGCPAEGLLVFKGFTPGTLKARALSVVVVDQQFELLEYAWDQTVPEQTSSVHITAARKSTVQAFVSWTEAPQKMGDVKRALSELRESGARDKLALPGLLEQRQVTIMLRGAHGR